MKYIHLSLKTVHSCVAVGKKLKLTITNVFELASCLLVIIHLLGNNIPCFECDILRASGRCKGC